MAFTQPPLIVPQKDSSPTSRRDFMAAALAAGMSLATASDVWAQAARAETPVKGGNLRIGLAGGSTTDTMDSSFWGDTFMVMVGYAARAGLTEFGADGSLKPDAAESWEVSDGGKRWVFRIRRGATFSNGKSLTAEDVVASLNFHRGAKSRSGSKSIFDAVTDIKADNPQTVTVTLSAPNLDFAYLMTDHRVNIMPSVNGEADWQSGIGPGPYTVSEFQPGVRAVLKRNPNSYRTAHLDSVEMIGIKDVVARQAALASGAVDVINRVDLKTADLLRNRPGLKVEQTAGRLHYWLVFDTTQKPFNDPNVRMAMKYAMDREEILKVVFRGYGSVGNDQPITPTYRYYDPSIKAKAYDPEIAKSWLKKSGLDRISVDLHVSEASFTGAVDTCVLYARQAAKANINVNVIREAPDGWSAKMAASRPPFFTTYWSGRATEDGMLTVGMAKGSPTNRAQWDNPEFNRLLAAARSETDDARRRKMYSDMQRLVSDDCGVLVPIFANSVFAVNDKVRHPAVLAGNWEMDGGRLFERWWMRG